MSNSRAAYTLHTSDVPEHVEAAALASVYGIIIQTYLEAKAAGIDEGGGDVKKDNDTPGLAIAVSVDERVSSCE